MKIHVKFIFLLIPLVLCLSACGSGPEPERHTTVFDEPWYDWEATPQETIVIWGNEHDVERIYMQRAFERYQELSGSQLEVVTFSQIEYEEAIRQAVLGNIDKPDVLLSYGGTNIDAFAPDENLYDFSDAVWVKDLTATSINQTIYHGKVIGLPHGESSISGMLYNKDLFKKFGIDVPDNQTEFLEVCRVLKENGITPLYLPYKEITMLLYQFPMDSILEDSEILEGLNNGTLSYSDIPEMREIVKWYRSMADSGFFGENYLENNWDGMDEAMVSETHGMMICWDTWLYTNFTGDANDFGIMPAFMGTPEEGTFEGPNQMLFVVNRNSPKLDAALNFITFLGDPYNYNVAFEGIYTASAFKNQAASISTPQYAETERLIEERFRDSTAWLRVKGFSQMDATCIQKYMIGEPGYTVEDCLREMDQFREDRLTFSGIMNKSGR